MGKCGNVDCSGLIELKKNLENLTKTDTEAICKDCSKELAARLLALVIPATPVGIYPKDSGKLGGTLRRGWTASADTTNATKQAMYENLFGSDQKVNKKDIVVMKKGNVYITIIKNPVEYAIYVEYGHRTRGGKGWIPGQHFLTISEEKLKTIAPKVLERKLNKRLKEVLGGTN